MLHILPWGRIFLVLFPLFAVGRPTLPSSLQPAAAPELANSEDDFIKHNQLDLQGDISLLDDTLTIDTKYKEALHAIFHKKKRKLLTSSRYKQHRLSLLAYGKTLRAYQLVQGSTSLPEAEKASFERRLSKQLQDQRQETLRLLERVLIYEKSLLHEVLVEFQAYVNYHETI